MKRTTRAIAAIMLMLAAVLVAGCTKDNLTGQDDRPGELTVNPGFVPIDWTTTTMISANDSTGDYRIQFSDTVPNFVPGSIIALDRDTVVLYRFVLTATTQGNTVMLTTTEAYLTDIFSDVEFTLSTVAEGKSQAKGIVFYPVEAYMLDGKGGYQVLRLDGNRKDDTRFTHNLWSFDYNNDGQVLFSGNNWSIYMERMNLDLSLDMEMFMNFGGKTELEVVGDAIDRYRSKALKVSAALVGTFNTEQMVRCDVEGSCIYSPDYDLWKHNLFRPLSIKFMAGPVPIVLTLRSDLFRQVEVTASGEISAYTGFSDHAEGRMGFEWQQTDGMNPVAAFENTFNFTPPTVEGKGQIQAKVWAFPRISVMLYDAVGPSFDFMPYLSTTVRGGFREQMLGQTNDYCAWSLDCNTGMDVRCGLSFRFFGYEVENYSTPQWNVIDRTLYHSPKKIVHASGRPQGGQTATVRFDVYDQNYLFDSEVMTPLPQIVKFEASGNLSSEYSIAHSGTVQVSWTPNSNDTLWAKLYDQDGNVLSFDTVIVKCDCNLTSGDWVDLGLPSGLLWATRNVGASSPMGYGNYYAWGETSPKSIYSPNNYRYFDASTWHVTKYCNDASWGYQGYTDNLTTLQSGDDAATANYGGRTPTPAEWSELINNTTSRRVTINGVNGYCLTGTNGNSIFLPAAGFYTWTSAEGGNFIGESYDGHYWSSTLYSGHPLSAWTYCFYSYNDVGVRSFCDRPSGLSVRAVRQP